LWEVTNEQGLQITHPKYKSVRAVAQSRVKREHPSWWPLGQSHRQTNPI